jgi:hypothetical protein
MTRTTIARVAGCTYLVYIAAALAQGVLFGKATSADGIAAKLAGIAQHATDVRASVVLSLLCCFAALVLAVTLYRLTRDQNPDLAMLAMACRVGEGVLNTIPVMVTVGLLWLGMSAGASAMNAEATNLLGTFLFKVLAWNTMISSVFFAVGSTLFSYLFLRGGSIPAPLAWLGILTSLLLVLAAPVQLAGFMNGPVLDFMWLPVGVFELALALWLLIKGVATPSDTTGFG